MILVVGATGALGGQITRELLAGQQAVRVLVRPGSDYGAIVEAGAHPVMGDLKDPESLARACAGVDTVLSTANSARRGGADTADAVDRDGNRALVDAAAAAGVDHFIFVSALGAALDSPVDFLRAKAEAEAALQRSGMTWTVLQPNLFMEVWLNLMIGLPVQQGRPVTLVGRGDHRHSFVSMADVTAYAVAAVNHPAARNEVLVICGPEALSWTDVVNLAAEVRGAPIDVGYVAPGEPIPGLPEVASQLAAAMETYETVIDTSGTARTFGVRLTSMRDFLRGMIPLTAM